MRLWLIFRCGEGAFRLTTVVARSFDAGRTFHGAGINYGSEVAAKGEIDFIALHGAGEVRFAELSVIGAGEFLARLFELKRRRSAACIQDDVEGPFSGNIGGETQGREKQQQNDGPHAVSITR